MLYNISEGRTLWVNVLASLGGLSFLVLVCLLIPTRAWRAVWNLFPFRFIRTMLRQLTNPSAYLFIQKSHFEFLPMSGGTNSRVLTMELSIVSALLRDLKIDRLDIVMTYPIIETFRIDRDILILLSSSTKMEKTTVPLADASFRTLAEWAKPTKAKRVINLHCKIIGFRNGKRRFSIEHSDNYDGVLNEWGANNPQWEDKDATS